MKSWQVGATVITLTALAILLTPVDTKDSMGESWRRLTGDPGQLCFDYERKALKDPYSARLDSYQAEATNPHNVTVKYHAKNSFGAFGAGEALCSISSGAVDEVHTKLLREERSIEDHLRKLNADIACLERRNAFIHRGQPIEEATAAAGGPCDSATR